MASGTISGVARPGGAADGARGRSRQVSWRRNYPELQRVRASLQNAAKSNLAPDRARSRRRTPDGREITYAGAVPPAEHYGADKAAQFRGCRASATPRERRTRSDRCYSTLRREWAETAANPAFITPNSTIASRANASAASTSSKAKVLAFAGGFVGLTLGSLLSLLLELRDKGFRTSAQVQQHIGSLTVSATPRAVGRRRKSPADIILNDNRSAFAEAFRVSWANIHLAVAGPRSASFGGRRLGTALGITSAASGEGKSMHALALARTAALAGENVVLVDADLRRSGVSRLLDQDFCFTLRDFLQDRCTANDVIAIEERSGVHFVPSTPADFSWTSQRPPAIFQFRRLLEGSICHSDNRLAADPRPCRDNPSGNGSGQHSAGHSLGPHRTSVRAIRAGCSPQRQRLDDCGDLKRHRPESPATARLSRPHRRLYGQGALSRAPGTRVSRAGCASVIANGSCRSRMHIPRPEVGTATW